MSKNAISQMQEMREREKMKLLKL